MPKLRAFIRLSRPLFLAGGAAGVGLGTALAAYVSNAPIDWRAWLVAQFTVTAFQLMTQYSNEYFDRAADVLATRTPFSGGSGVLVAGDLPPHVALLSSVVARWVGVIGIVALALLGHKTAAVVAFAIVVLAKSYSAWPRLSARGWGELATAVIVGVLVPLCAFFAQGRAFSPLALAATLPGAAAMFAMMLAVELPDFDADTLAEKRNLLVRLGRSSIVPLGQAALIAVYAGLAIAYALGAPLSVVILIALTLPAAFALARGFVRIAEERSPPEQAARGEAMVAARGVAFFFLVSVAGLLGYLVPLQWRI